MARYPDQGPYRDPGRCGAKPPATAGRTARPVRGLSSPERGDGEEDQQGHEDHRAGDDIRARVVRKVRCGHEPQARLPPSHHPNPSIRRYRRGGRARSQRSVPVPETLITRPGSRNRRLVNVHAPAVPGFTLAPGR